MDADNIDMAVFFMGLAAVMIAVTVISGWQWALLSVGVAMCVLALRR